MLLEGDGYGGAEGGLKGVEYWKQLSMFRHLSVVHSKDCRPPFVRSVDEHMTQGPGFDLLQSGIGLYGLLLRFQSFALRPCRSVDTR
jgi:hypothetical protein